MTPTELVEKLARPELLKLNGYSSARSEAGIAPIILNANENPYPAIIGEADWQINRYPPPQPEVVIKQLSKLYSVTNEQIMVTRGSDEGIDLLIRSFCTAGDDRVVYCPPTFGMYSVSAGIQNALLEAVELSSDDWQLNIQAIVAAQPKVVFLCNPNNPTGHLLKTTNIEMLCETLSEQALVIVDEAYIEFANHNSMASKLHQYSNLIVLRTLSKAWGMAGLRCGAILANAPIISFLRKIMAPYPLSIATQKLVEKALQPDHQAIVTQQVRQLCNERDQLADQLQSLDAIERCWPSYTNFLLVNVENAERLVLAAAEDGILLRNQSNQPGLNNCVRISIGTPEENQQVLTFFENYI